MSGHLPPNEIRVLAEGDFDRQWVGFFLHARAVHNVYHHARHFRRCHAQRVAESCNLGKDGRVVTGFDHTLLVLLLVNLRARSADLAVAHVRGEITDPRTL